MKISLSLIISFLLISFCTEAQVVNYLKTFGGNAYNDVRSIVSYPNGEIACTGLSKAGVDASGDVYLMRLNGVGDILTMQYFGKPKEDGGNGLIKTKDNGLLICGHTALPSSGADCDAMITKLDSNDKLLWQINLGGVEDETSYEALEMSDGSFWIAGTLHYEKTGIRSGILFHITSQGNLIETDTIPGSHSDNYIAQRLVLRENGNLLIAGSVPEHYYDDNNNGTSYSAFGYVAELKLNAQPSATPKFVNRLYGPSGHCKLYDFLYSPKTKNYFAFGTSGFNYDYNNIDSIYVGYIWGEKLDSNILTNYINKGLFGVNIKGIIKDAIVDSVGNIIVVGEMQSLSKTSFAFWAVLDTNLNVMFWDKLDIENSTASCVCLGPNKSFFFGGRQVVEGETQMLVAHISPYYTTVGTKLIVKKNVTLSPNPVRQTLNLKFDTDDHLWHLVIYDAKGNKLESHNINSTDFQVNCSTFPSGIYFYSLLNLNTNKIQSGSFMVR